MKKLAILVALFALLVVSAPVQAAKPTQFDAIGNEKGWEQTNCNTIESGLITDTAGNPISLGYDQFGYNYQAHMFNGTYDGSDRNLDGTYWGQTGDYVDDKLMMKWSDAWLANVDCNKDGKLDRGLIDGVVGGISKGWLTNHVVGDYVDTNTNIDPHYTDFTKIVWVGNCVADPTLVPEGGYCLWGQYTIIQEVYNDPAMGFNGLYSKFGAPGFGLNDQWTTTLP